MPKQFSKQRDIDVSLRLVVVTSIELKLVELNRALRGGITFKHARAPLHRSGHLLPPSAQATGQPGAEPGAQSLEVLAVPKARDTSNYLLRRSYFTATHLTAHRPCHWVTR